jgi:3-deoxy-D-manno-octulosonic-acid transferase
MRWFYTLLFYLLLPAILLRLWWRGRRAPAYRRRIGERFGFFATPRLRSPIWVHAVSVGETIAAAPMIRALLAQGEQLVVTTMTPTGSERVRALFGEQVFHVYAPYDLPDCLGRFLRRIRPRLLVIVETELWPNTVHACAARGIPALLANARLSARSARGYARVEGLTRAMLGELTRVVAQNAEDGGRFVALGLPPERLRVSGSIKFDIAIDDSLRQRAAAERAAWGAAQRLVWIAASTHEGEDEVLLQAHRQLLAVRPDALLVLVPRHPERFDGVAALVARAGLSCARRSRGDRVTTDTAVLLGDTMGELLLLLGCADMAFVGGSLIERGGHNMLEPAAWGLAVITGDSDYNFREISAGLQQAGALVKVTDGEALGRELQALATDGELRRQRGERAAAMVAANRGALDRLLAAIGELAQEQP